MRNLSAAELLSAWERTRDQPPALQALALLSVAAPECPVEGLARLSVGQRDAHLLVLRERLFGPRLDGFTTCPECGQRIELGFGVADIRAEGPESLPDEPEQAISLTSDGYRVRFRLPTGLDLASLDPTASADEARVQLLDRCIESVVRDGADGEGEASDRLPAMVVAAIAERMTEADPQADTRLALSCPECHHQWQVPFDIAAYLVAEIEELAGRFLREVHILALAYGWAEADILALSPARRQAYLELVGP